MWWRVNGVFSLFVADSTSAPALEQPATANDYNNTKRKNGWYNKTRKKRNRVDVLYWLVGSVCG
jgi:hypothetical protein